MLGAMAITAGWAIMFAILAKTGSMLVRTLTRASLPITASELCMLFMPMSWAAGRKSLWKGLLDCGEF